jgi:hypothetical protein
MEVITMYGQNGATKEFCAKCHMTFGSAEPRVAIDRTRVMHEDCYVKHLRDLSQRDNRISAHIAQHLN